MRGRRIVVGETCIDAQADDAFLDMIPGLIRDAREQIASAIDCDLAFLTSLAPLDAPGGAAPLISRMCSASSAAGVGPMASVAGAVASHVLEGLIDRGCEFAMIDNGGDIAAVSDRPFSVGLFTGDASTSDLFLRFGPTGGTMGICSSSSAVGPSLSFGCCDIATVVCRDPVLADACATALGNSIKSPDDLLTETERICAIPGVIGCLAAVGGSVAICGDIPDPVRRRSRLIKG